MSLIRITKIYEGAEGVESSCGINEITMEFAKSSGLLKYSAWLYDVREGETMTVPFRSIDDIRRAGHGVFEFEVLHPKYANRHLYSDVEPYEIIEWKNETTVVVRKLDTSDYFGVMGENCSTYTSNVRNETLTVREHKNGRLYEAGTNYCPFILSEEPQYYRDPSF